MIVLQVEGSSGKRYSYNDVIQNVNRVHAVIDRLVINHDDVVLTCMGNCPEYAFLFLALTSRGIVMTAANPEFTKCTYIQFSEICHGFSLVLR